MERDWGILAIAPIGNTYDPSWLLTLATGTETCFGRKQITWSAPLFGGPRQTKKFYAFSAHSPLRAQPEKQKLSNLRFG
jgi:hypothetical protein